MRVLGIESTESRGGVAIVEDGRLVLEELLPEDRSHGRLLIPLARAALGRAGWAVRDLDRVAVDRGPGSYTGIRIGIALAKSLSLSLDVSVAGLDRFDLAAAAAPMTGRFAPVLDTRRGHVGAAVFERPSPGSPARRLTEDLSVEPRELLERLEGPTTIFGSGAETYRETFAAHPALSIADPALVDVAPAAVALAGAEPFPAGSLHQLLEPIEADALVPIYLRATAAEEGRLVTGRPRRSS